jgi:septum formation topological specificity factor MinE
VKRLIKTLEKQVHDASKADNRLRIAVALRESFKEYRQVRCEAKREEIEVLVNKYFETLMSGLRIPANVNTDSGTT